MVKKIIVDTNILVSALGWNGLEKELMVKCFKGEFLLFLSTQILDELEKVLNYPKFNFSEEEKNSYLKILKANCNIKNIESFLDVVKDDPSDNKFLECAIINKVDFLVTGDKHLLKLKQYSGIKIIKTVGILQSN